MLVVSHMLLVLILISGFSYTRYQSEWNRHIEYSASLAKLTLAPHISFISTSVAGLNYANLTMPATKDLFGAIDDLEFLDITGQSDYSSQTIHVSYFKRLEYLWRADVSQEELKELENKLSQLKDQIEATAPENVIRHKKLQFIQNRVKREYDAVTESIFASENIYIPWQKSPVNSESYYLDEELCTLNIVLPLRNKNGGEVWAVFDASDLTDLQHSLLEEIIAEAIVALAISLVLIGWVSHWIVSPLKSLANHMRSDNTSENLNTLRELERSDEIGQLARAYQGLLTKLDHQLNILRTRSDTDPLTGLGSRYKYSRTAIPFLKRHLANGQYVGLIICDVDNFKAFNDIYGHTEGDNALSLVGSKMSEIARDSDLAFRYGGEEFVLLCARPEMNQLISFTQRLRTEIEGLNVIHAGNQPYGALTISVGGSAASLKDINEHFVTHQELQESMFNVADKALYVGKQNGRNQVTWSGCKQDHIKESA
ncbi:sensor domain-containing diguanylate cyclase [Vibrio orientalis]|nr:sensor domain-containing diguanylate cyclase [Vibrio orientalis]